MDRALLIHALAAWSAFGAIAQAPQRWEKQMVLGTSFTYITLSLSAASPLFHNEFTATC